MSEKIKEYIVIWDSDAKTQLRSIFDHIKYQSLQNAHQVKNSILGTARSLKNMPERYEVYEPMRNLPGNYRYKQVSSYTIIYDIEDSEVHIVKIAHNREDQ